mgnify:CR=1 FL=1
MASYEDIKFNVIEDGIVTTAEIADGAVTTDKLASTLDVSSKTVTLPNTSVTNAQLAGSVDATTKFTGVTPVANGGTGVSSLGSAGQILKVNSAGNALEFGTETGGKTVEVFTNTENITSGFADGAQIGTALSFTPTVTGRAKFEGCFSYRHSASTHAYFAPRRGTTDLSTQGANYNTASSGFNQGTSFCVDYGNVTAGTSYNANVRLQTAGASINQGGDSGDDKHLIVTVYES